MSKNWILILSLTLIIFFTHAFGQGGLDQRISELSQQIAKEMTEYNKTTIAVIEFSDLQGNVTDFGRFIAEELITRLYQTKKFKVIERHLLNKIIAEQKLSLTGIVDPASAKQLGKILSVDAIVSGSITDLAQSLRINARLISTETGEIFAVASTEIFKDESVMKLLQTGVTTTTDKKTQPTPTSPPKKVIQKFELGNFTFELKEVKMIGSAVILEFTVTNNGPDAELKLFGGIMYDNNNYEYVEGEVQLLNRKGNFAPWYGREAGYFLISGIPVPAQWRFFNVSPEAQSIALVKLGTSAGEILIRDLPIKK